jgi:hypothetical protein
LSLFFSFNSRISFSALFASLHSFFLAVRVRATLAIFVYSILVDIRNQVQSCCLPTSTYFTSVKTDPFQSWLPLSRQVLNNVTRSVFAVEQIQAEALPVSCTIPIFAPMSTPKRLQSLLPFHPSIYTKGWEDCHQLIAALSFDSAQMILHI